jgi:hypothetical protein
MTNCQIPSSRARPRRRYPRRIELELEPLAFFGPLSFEIGHFVVMVSVLVPMPWKLFPVNRAKNQMQLLCLDPQFTCFGAEAFFGSRNHAEKKLGFFGFLATRADFVSKIPLGNRIVCFAVVCPHAGARADQLIDQTVVDRVLRYLFRKPDDGLTKSCGTLFQVKFPRCCRTIPVAVPQHHWLGLFPGFVPGTRCLRIWDLGFGFSLSLGHLKLVIL